MNQRLLLCQPVNAVEDEGAVELKQVVGRCHRVTEDDDTCLFFLSLFFFRSRDSEVEGTTFGVFDLLLDEATSDLAEQGAVLHCAHKTENSAESRCVWTFDAEHTTSLGTCRCSQSQGACRHEVGQHHAFGASGLDLDGSRPTQDSSCAAIKALGDRVALVELADIRKQWVLLEARGEVEDESTVCLDTVCVECFFQVGLDEGLLEDHHFAAFF